MVLKAFNENVQYQFLQQRTEDVMRDDGLQEDNLGQLPVHHPLIKDGISDEGWSALLIEPQFLDPKGSLRGSAGLECCRSDQIYQYPTSFTDRLIKPLLK